MLLTLALVVLIALALGLTLYVRPQDLPKPEPESPYRHLDERKARIYENLRDLQFEYRLGKLSDEDYQSAKLGLQKELAQVLADTEAMKASLAGAAAPVAAAAAVRDPLVCVHCKAKMPKPMKYCGECGKELAK